MATAYLNSIDYISACLNDSCRLSPGEANHFVLRVDLSRPPDLPWITVHIRQRIGLMPILTGNMRRNLFHLAPYWQWDNSQKMRVEILHENECSVSSYINTPLKEDTCCGVLICGTILLFKFSHLLFDHAGAERFLCWIFSDAPAPKNPGWLESSHWNDWKRQTACCKTIRKSFLHDHDSPIAVFPEKTEAETCVISRTWDAAQITAEAEEFAGPFMLIPYLMAKCAIALEPFLPKNGNIVIPMTVDQRGEEDQSAESMLFNHWSLMPLQIPGEARGDLKKCTSALKRAYFENTANRLPTQFRHAAYLLRYIPFFMLRRMAEQYSTKWGGTFQFSYMESHMPDDLYTGHSKVLDIRHYSVIPPHPGIGFFFSRTGNNLHLTVSCREGILPDVGLLESNLETLFHHGVKDDL
ncbi:MAG: hypothetical protein IKB16_11345 [Lentisphaeria bacterium]|nr:hypothetical protein [Lentisphaeria bacterium]